VDPLDGTKQYILKDYSEAECVTILIGIVWHGRPIAGVINQPFHRKAPANDTYVERIIWGIVGLGWITFSLFSKKI
jgi:3'-phosphoadenosine 5'-phosphosulfate (PAPS) 3'-phosphatase